MDILRVVYKRIVAFFLSILAVFHLAPVTPAPSAGEPDAPAAYVFSTQEEYYNYYFYCKEEDPEPYSWSPEALAARENVARIISAEGFRVTLFKNGTARIEALEAPVREAAIPAEVEGCPVVAVYSILPRNDYETAGRIADALKSVTIPNTVEYILEGAFEDLSNLRTVQFGSRVKYMEANAFRDCTLLTGVILPNSLDSVPAVAFSGCAALTEVTFGKNIRSIGRYAFDDCPGLRKITLPDSVTEIAEYGFSQCGSLTYAYVPASVTSIGYNAFARCPGLTLHGEAGSAVEAYAAENGILFRAGK